MVKILKINKLLQLNPNYYYVGNYSKLDGKTGINYIYEENFQIMSVLSLIDKKFLFEQKAVLINNVFCLFSEDNTSYIRAIDKMLSIYISRKLQKPIIVPIKIFDEKLDTLIINRLQEKSKNISVNILIRNKVVYDEQY